tara:strand:- start:237 stop:917 length:681 start_codon:yes stop_codon:yes gene_type:complete
MRKNADNKHMDTKICAVCKEEKSVNKFGKRSDRKTTQYRYACKKCDAQFRRERRKAPEVKEKEKAYKQRPSVRMKDNKRRKLIRQQNPLYRLPTNIASEMRYALGRDKQGIHWEDIVGYSLNELKDHLESLFQHGMTWDNYTFRGWHIDHIVPINVFRLDDDNWQDVLKTMWQLNNLQPLWYYDNIRKNDRLDFDNPRTIPIIQSIPIHFFKPSFASLIENPCQSY